MSRSIEVSDATFARLGAMAIPFVDTSPEDVIKRLLRHYEGNGAVQPSQAKQVNAGPNEALYRGDPEYRQPRERGATVEISGETIHAVSVPDLYQQTLRLIFQRGAGDKLKAFVPYRTSNQRYLIATEPIHPTGNGFVVPIDYKGYFMEAHKSYRTAIGALERFLPKLGLTIRYIG